jgi:hypothetical protein
MIKGYPSSSQTLESVVDGDLISPTFLSHLPIVIIAFLGGFIGPKLPIP